MRKISSLSSSYSKDGHGHQCRFEYRDVAETCWSDQGTLCVGLCFQFVHERSSNCATPLTSNSKPPLIHANMHYNWAIQDWKCSAEWIALSAVSDFIYMEAVRGLLRLTEIYSLFSWPKRKCNVLVLAVDTWSSILLLFILSKQYFSFQH